MNKQKKLFLIKLAYWLGIGADALWAVGLFFHPIFSMLTGNPNFKPDWELRSAMAIGGILMTGWTILLLWAVRQPIERRFVILLTAFPVVFGLLIVALTNVLKGNTYEIWIVIKSSVLFISMIASYIFADKIAKENL